MGKIGLLCLVTAWFLPTFANAEVQRELELGFLQTQRNEVYGYQQTSATEGWKGSIPTARFEYWWQKESPWTFGVIAQPLYVHYHANIQNDLSAKSQTFKAGDLATLDYQFHTLRWTASYLVVGDKLTYLRLGGSVVARYADVKLEAASGSIHDTNLLALPLFHLEASLPLVDRYSFFTRSDFLPSPTDKVLYDGLFDILFALRYKSQQENNYDVGLRLFFGGYDPKSPNDYANKIFFYALVARYTL